MLQKGGKNVYALDFEGHPEFNIARFELGRTYREDETFTYMDEPWNIASITHATKGQPDVLHLRRGPSLSGPQPRDPHSAPSAH